MRYEFMADHCKVIGPMSSDGSYKVEFKTGEYEKENVANLMRLPKQVALKITVDIVSVDQVDSTAVGLIDSGEGGGIGGN